MLGPFDSQIIFRDRGGREIAAAEAAAASEAGEYRFGRMLDVKDDTTDENAGEEIAGLFRLGAAVNTTQLAGGAGASGSGDSDIPAGYTYLGQFIAHEVAFDPREVVPLEEVDVDALRQVRSPALDLDSLYAGGPDAAPAGMFKPDKVRMEVGTTTPSHFWGQPEPFDLPRGAPGTAPGTPEHRRAIIGDKRNDENLATAQTHLAFIYFHNAVADWLDGERGRPATFEDVRDLVVRHFQYVVLHDYLPKVVDPKAIEKVLAHVRANGGQPEFFRPPKGGELYTPVEFSGACFRFGHSMVRNFYEWNFFHNSKLETGGAVEELFAQTGLSGNFVNQDSLQSEWVINWKRFYNFPGSGLPVNMARRIDTSFNFRIDKIAAAARGGNPDPLTTLNLLRGFALRLPSGQQAADALGEQKLSPDEIARGPHEGVLRAHGYHERTPLWYYTLKEAELAGKGNGLGPVGSRVVAETVVGMILNSGFSIIDPEDAAQDWKPVLPVLGGGGFDMPSLLTFARVVDHFAAG